MGRTICKVFYRIVAWKQRSINWFVVSWDCRLGSICLSWGVQFSHFLLRPTYWVIQLIRPRSCSANLNSTFFCDGQTHFIGWRPLVIAVNNVCYDTSWSFEPSIRIVNLIEIIHCIRLNARIFFWISLRRLTQFTFQLLRLFNILNFSNSSTLVNTVGTLILFYA